MSFWSFIGKMLMLDYLFGRLTGKSRVAPRSAVMNRGTEHMSSDYYGYTDVCASDVEERMDNLEYLMDDLDEHLSDYDDSYNAHETYDYLHDEIDDAYDYLDDDDW